CANPTSTTSRSPRKPPITAPTDPGGVTPGSDAASYKSRMGVGRIFKAWRYSMQGLRAAIRHEAAFRQELILAVVLVPGAFLLGRDIAEITLLLAAILVVLITELLNSAIEAVAD